MWKKKKKFTFPISIYDAHTHTHTTHLMIPIPHSFGWWFCAASALSFYHNWGDFNALYFASLLQHIRYTHTHIHYTPLAHFRHNNISSILQGTYTQSQRATRLCIWVVVSVWAMRWHSIKSVMLPSIYTDFIYSLFYSVVEWKVCFSACFSLPFI